MRIVIFTGDYRKSAFLSEEFQKTPENKGVVEALAEFHLQVSSKGSELQRESSVCRNARFYRVLRCVLLEFFIFASPLFHEKMSYAP